MRRQRGVILPVVLVLVGLLALVMAGFIFFVRAEVAGTQARRDGQQARLAAESGLQEVITVLRTARDDPTAWLDVPERFRHGLVWSEGYVREDDPVRKLGSRKELLERGSPVPAWRFSVVAANRDGPPDTIRFGVTPEAGKLNLNAASETEIRRLLEPLLLELGLERAPKLVACLLDWLDEDDDPRPDGAENEYYTTLEPAYYAKNGPLDTLEELLLVRGFSAAVLDGEDTNRNGVLDANEDDGAASFPYYDNADGILNPGIAAFATVWSQEPGQNNQPVRGRINVNVAPLRVLQALDDMPPDAAERIVALRRELDGQTLQQADWVVTAGALDAATYELLKDRLTVKALQFHVEILGYADHLRLVQRYEWIVEMRGPLAQVLYHRDLTRLGPAWPIDDDTFIVETR